MCLDQEKAYIKTLILPKLNKSFTKHNKNLNKIVEVKKRKCNGPKILNKTRTNDSDYLYITNWNLNYAYLAFNNYR